MRGVENRLDFVEADAWILDVTTHSIGVAFEGLDGEFGARALKGEIILEKIAVPVNVRDRQHLQRETVVAHEIGDRRDWS